jgi:hypothetical protein
MDKPQEICEIWSGNRGVAESLGLPECKFLSLDEWVLSFFFDYLTLGK